MLYSWMQTYLKMTFTWQSLIVRVLLVTWSQHIDWPLFLSLSSAALSARCCCLDRWLSSWACSVTAVLSPLGWGVESRNSGHHSRREKCCHGLPPVSQRWDFIDGILPSTLVMPQWGLFPPVYKIKTLNTKCTGDFTRKAQIMQIFVVSHVRPFSTLTLNKKDA